MDSTIKAYDQMLSFAGISVFAKRNWNSKAWLTLQVLCIAIMKSALIFSFNFVIFSLPDLRTSMQTAAVTVSFNITLITLSVFLIKKRNFEKLLDEMIFRDPALENPIIEYILKSPCVTGRQSNKFKLLIHSSQKLLKFCGSFVKFYVYGVVLIVTLYMFAPMYSSRVERINMSARMLPLEMKFPWSTDNVVVYALTFVYQVLAGYLCSIGFPCFLSLLILFVLQIRRQIKLLSFIIFHLNEIVLEIIDKNDEDWQPACSSVMLMCMNHYFKTKSFADRLNAACKPFFVGIVLAAIMLEGVCLVNIALIHRFNVDNIKYGGELMLIMVGMFIFSLLGQTIDDACAELETAVTDKWYIFDMNYKKNILIFHLALTQRIPIHIYGSITLTFETFTWFVKTGMSFFTLIMSVLET